MMRSFGQSSSLARFGLVRRMHVISLLALLLAVGCTSTETRTQLTFRIAASAALQARIATLSVVIRSNNVGDQSHDFPSSALTVWPVEIVVTPVNGNHSSDDVTLIVSARDANNLTIVGPITKVATFSPEKLLKVDVPLDTLDPDAGAADAGVKDASRPPADGGPGPITVPDSGPGPVGEPDAGPEPMDDGGSGVTNCASTGSTIKCDDLNPCNGTERCEPTNGGANNDGCVKGTDVVSCASGTTCDSTSGQCSACLTNADGDKDGVNSVSCGGADCNDSDATIAPGKPELCDGKDNDCDGVIDGVAADPSCALFAPTGGTASCMATRCARMCTVPTDIIVNRVCITPAVCAAGTHSSLDMTHCIPTGIPAHDVGFESGVVGGCTAPIDPTSPFSVAGTAPIAGTLYAACGLATIANGDGTLPVLLSQPSPGPLAGITGATVLASAGTTTASSALVFTFSPAVNTLNFNVLGVSDPTLVSVTAVAAAGASPAPANPTLAASGMYLQFAAMYSGAISSVTVTYAPAPPLSSEFYIDELSFRVAGCGDLVPDAAAGEACDSATCCTTDCAPVPAGTVGCP